MQPLDYAVIAGYFAALLALSGWLGRRQADESDYFVAGRRLPWWALGISTMATQSSANSFIGIPAFVALVPGGGMTWLQYELAVPLALLLVARYLTPVFHGLGVVSIYEYLEQRFDRATRLLLSAVFLVSRALATGVALYAAAVVVRVCTGLPLPASILLMGIVTVAYDVVGGMKAVVWSDVLQMVLMLGGIGVCLWIALQTVGGWPGVIGQVDPARLAAISTGNGIGDGARVPLWGFVVGGLVLYVAYYGVDQTQVQRQLSARDIGDAQRQLFLNAIARYPLAMLYALLGLAMAAVWAVDPALREAVPAGRLDFLVPRFIELHLPIGVRGVLVAAIMAAAMSSLDSALNSLAAATTRDFLDARIPDSRRLLASRLTSLAWGLVMTGVALKAGDWSSNVVEGINRVGALFYGPLLAAFVCGLADRRATGPGVRAGVAAGIATNVALWLVLEARLFWMWWNVSGLVAAVVVTMLVSRLLPAPRPAADVAALWEAQSRLSNAAAPGRRWTVALVAYTAFMAACLTLLGVRPAP